MNTLLEIEPPPTISQRQMQLLDMYRNRCRQGIHQSNGVQYPVYDTPNMFIGAPNYPDPSLVKIGRRLKCVHCSEFYDD